MYWRRYDNDLKSVTSVSAELSENLLDNLKKVGDKQTNISLQSLLSEMPERTPFTIYNQLFVTQSMYLGTQTIEIGLVDLGNTERFLPFDASQEYPVWTPNSGTLSKINNLPSITIFKNRTILPCQTLLGASKKSLERVDNETVYKLKQTWLPFINSTSMSFPPVRDERDSDESGFSLSIEKKPSAFSIGHINCISNGNSITVKALPSSHTGAVEEDILEDVLKGVTSILLMVHPFDRVPVQPIWEGRQYISDKMPRFYYPSTYQREFPAKETISQKDTIDVVRAEDEEIESTTIMFFLRMVQGMK